MSGPSENSTQPHLHSARSFTRMDGSNVKSPTIEQDSKTTPLSSPVNIEGQENGPDVFERRDSADSGTAGDAQTDDGFVLSRSVQDPSEELPIELISLADRFVNSLSARVHNSPPTIEKISELFQVFYSRAESHIATHISALITRINRDLSPQIPAKAPRGSALSKLSSKRSQDDIRQGASGRQMLTASEVAERRKARRALENKRSALEEAAERRVCELVYDKLWRHKSTLDDVRDEKLRSKTAALLLVGINLKDLGIDIDLEAIDEQKQDEANEFLCQAREYLAKMNDYKYPLGKLQQLAAAHKAIVDALTKLLPSSSSADEILPTLIYSLVTCPPEGINIVSNLVFIQRFRSSNRIDGETAYCLTNLEAAISFLENVDLSTLRADELQDGPLKTPSETTTPSADRVDPFRPPKEATTLAVTTVSASPELSKPEIKEPTSSTLPRPRPSATPQQRRLSNLFQPPSKVLGAANDAVRTTADQGLKNIGATLDSSFNFLFGRLKEMQNIQGPGPEGSGPILPKTLAEARRLVSLPPASAANQNLTQGELAAINSVSVDETTPPRSSSRFTDLSSGGPAPRDRSVDSTRTQESGKKSITTSLREDFTSNSANSPTPLESMRNFGNTLNPLNHIPGMMKNFGRNTPETPSARSVSPSGLDRFKPSPASADGASGPVSPLPGSLKIDPPIQRFLETQDACDLRIGDVAVLLEDYKRLAAALYKPTAESR
ncbi:Vacuolar sorting protein 9 subgroup [Penicillium cf. griseofulvum]|uniref:Vacuolar sorting protein 9 subgroup n=1 Tax=Penicillium cf. griseofulvum TaxID=2972120 RepID=A0A9W9MA08_9EURO|nr:Vacuolar sorting protein 9 subgroup [Penicillium cf. griseofulvum]KAJ5445452.1 Vacuolar sorting protein 9 subgroup [Penicillium cf. griseofulvum]KAJ5447172.1 Vacuolar sorting protein 9 subgroup [Penicillium cf. griseofulvum]